MATNINTTYPGMVKGYAFPYQNTTTCAYSSSWVSSNNLGVLYAPMDSGATHVANYGGFGMPTVVLLGGVGANRRVLFVTQNFSTSDTTIMRDSILSMVSSGITGLDGRVSSFNVYPNPASDITSVNINLNEPANLLIDIADASGKQVALIMNESGSGIIKRQFDVATLPNGNYLLRLIVDGNIATRQITVSH
jgi:hypothetical protein